MVFFPFGRFYQTLALWLEEPRLHDTSLYLPSLPMQYNPELLSRLYNNVEVISLRVPSRRTFIIYTERVFT